MHLAKTAPLDPAKLTASDRALWSRFPADFRRFYAKQNGGFCAEDEAVELTIPMTWSMGGKSRKRQKNSLEELWRFDRRKLAKGPRSILLEHFGRHLAEAFLPRDVVVFGNCVQSCLVAISLAAHDLGNVYYWEWYWQYPWYKEFFLKRVERAVKRFDTKHQDLEGRTMSDAHTTGDAANYATLVKVADSFSAFVKGLRKSED